MDAFRPYVSQADRRAAAARGAKDATRRGDAWQPVERAVRGGRQMAETFWGRAWCDGLESHGDFANRLPRGRTYARNGSIVDLKIEKAEVRARVQGSALYQVRVQVAPLDKKAWSRLTASCQGQIASLVELLQGRFAGEVMGVLARPGKGMLPLPGQLRFACSCPDWASMCKHVAAALYGVGARLDERPELLFVLRDVDPQDLVSAAMRGAGGRAAAPAARGATGASTSTLIDGHALGDIFGIALDEPAPATATPAAQGVPAASRRERQPARSTGRASGAEASGRVRSGVGAGTTAGQSAGVNAGVSAGVKAGVGVAKASRASVRAGSAGPGPGSGRHAQGAGATTTAGRRGAKSAARTTVPVARRMGAAQRSVAPAAAGVAAMKRRRRPQPTKPARGS